MTQPLHRHVLLFVVVGLCILSQVTAPSQPAQASVADVVVAVPDGFQWRPDTGQGGPLLLTNFAAYDRGGVLPPGAAEIEVVREDAPVNGLAGYAKQDTLEAQVESSGEVPLNGSEGAIRLAYTDTFGPELRYANVTYYVRRGQYLYKFYLTARVNEPGWGEWTAAFDQLVRTATYTQ